ncbi:serine/threonine-protein kinase [Streptomyces sp. CC210A]|uniref:serine/threonine-protein kinase n=1 Tax=Streptomyces sp. CC210A TaxID=2898184 RepID=UPI001F2A5E6F|nr:serine/threonine-protein kinase [Streptomyces sp. CC210A]
MTPGGPAGAVPRGYRVAGWQVTELLGQGGWGTVYAARPVDPAGGRAPADVPDGVALGGPEQPPGGEPDEVALKFLPTAGLAPRQARDLVDSARREAELGQLVHHPRLVRMLDSVVVHDPARPELDGAVVLVMEREAASLADVLPHERTEEAAARLLAEVCEGLAQLHSMGWVHGDLKPGNVLVTRDGSARLSDFGLAVHLDGTHGYTAPVGTPDCLPPERWRAPLAERGIRVRPTADVWAFGILVHQMFTGGASPFPGATPGARAAAVQEYAEGRAALRLDPAVPPFWRELAADCLAPTHEARRAHPADALLARIRAEEARRPGPARRSRRRALAAAARAPSRCAGLWVAGWRTARTGPAGAAAVRPPRRPRRPPPYGCTTPRRTAVTGPAGTACAASAWPSTRRSRTRWTTSCRPGCGTGTCWPRPAGSPRGNRSRTRPGPGPWPGTGCGSRPVPAGATRGCPPCGPRTGPPSRTARRTRAPRPPRAEPCGQAVSRAGCRGRRCPSPRRRPTA